jgi:hypothetical protein
MGEGTWGLDIMDDLGEIGFESRTVESIESILNRRCVPS